MGGVFGGAGYSASWDDMSNFSSESSYSPPSSSSSSSSSCRIEGEEEGVPARTVPF